MEPLHFPGYETAGVGGVMGDRVDWGDRNDGGG